ncbi:diagnostic antigen gp50 [Echinococcus multilocularis]|uniref:Diagnostic antigen gp50 n=1 Tax=Echinococcus multilocularis TaxID=6211 RepID=A0A087W2G2_ECHMU|nr:diagnostic antigen gp50 [Echinococcus multilocularis]
MLTIIAILLCVAHFTHEQSPRLWGSRVTGRPMGRSDVMNYRIETGYSTHVSTAKGAEEMSFMDGNCIVNGTVWGSPCTVGNGTATITVDDVNRQKSIGIYRDTRYDVLLSTTFFVPYCNFSQPEKDEVDPRMSFPLSRFVKGQKSFQLDFAVGGAESDEIVVLESGEKTICEWRGANVTKTGDHGTVCTDLVKNTSSNLRIFRGTFSIPPGVEYETFNWLTATSALSVSVDYTQNGTSPEVAECNQYWEAQTSSGTTFSGECIFH